MKLIKRWGCITDVERELGIPHSTYQKYAVEKEIQQVVIIGNMNFENLIWKNK